MLKKILVSIFITTSLFSLTIKDVQRASKDKLGCIKGIGEKKLKAIIDYQKKSPIKSFDDLLNIKGIGKRIVENIKNDVLKKSCRRDKRASIQNKKISRPKKKIDAK